MSCVLLAILVWFGLFRSRSETVNIATQPILVDRSLDPVVRDCFPSPIELERDINTAVNSAGEQ